MSGRRYDPVEAKTVVTTLFVAAGVIGAAVQLLPLWPGADRGPIALVAAGPLVGALVLPRLRSLPYPVAAAHGAVSVLMLDLRGFKQVNDELGHHRGDEVLVQVAERLGGLAPPALPARLGGDEFAVLLPGVGADEALAAGHDVCDLLHGRYHLADGLEVPLGATVGVATQVRAPADGGPPGEEERTIALSALLAAADGAMYLARRKGRAVAAAVPAARAVPSPRGPRPAGLRSAGRATRGRRPEEQVPPDG